MPKNISRTAKDLVENYTSDYAMYVATERAIPSLMDGLKPVQRRLILSARDLGIFHNKKHLKTSKLVGQVMGDYHPHGGASPTVMVQPFKIRYPLFDGQGNWGCPDMPDSVAADRYTEIRLSEFAEDFYLESYDHADREKNYDGRLDEVTLFYPILPGALLTNASGIAVGLSTNIPTHTITDLCNSMLKYIEHPDTEEYLDGLYPETCEESIVETSMDEIRQMYKTGVGSIKYRAKTHYELVNGKTALVVDAFPPDFSKKRLETSMILEAVERGDLDLINESTGNIRYVFISNNQDVLNEIKERLTNSVSYRFNIEHRGTIRTYSLGLIYETFINEKSAFIERKYTDLRSKYQSEYDYLDILMKFKSDKQYIKDMFDKSSDEVVKDIISKYSTTEQIAKKIIGTSLRSLMSDNIKSIQDEMTRLTNHIEQASDFISNPMKKIIIDIKNLRVEFKSDKKRAIHIDELLSEQSLTVDNKIYKIKETSEYIVGYDNNVIRVIPGTKLLNESTLGIVSIVPTDKKYYVCYDEHGICAMEHDVIINDNKFNSQSLSGIYAVNNLSSIMITRDNGKKESLGEWALRKRLSYIKLTDNKLIIEGSES